MNGRGRTTCRLRSVRRRGRGGGRGGAGGTIKTNEIKKESRAVSQQTSELLKVKERVLIPGQGGLPLALLKSDRKSLGEKFIDSGNRDKFGNLSGVDLESNLKDLFEKSRR